MELIIWKVLACSKMMQRLETNGEGKSRRQLVHMEKQTLKQCVCEDVNNYINEIVTTHNTGISQHSVVYIHA